MKTITIILAVVILTLLALIFGIIFRPRPTYKVVGYEKDKDRYTIEDSKGNKYIGSPTVFYKVGDTFQRCSTTMEGFFCELIEQYEYENE